MKSIRFLVTLPKEIAQALDTFAEEQDVHSSIVAQRAVTTMCQASPENDDIAYDRGNTTGVQLSFSDTAYQLLELWSAKTKLSKSKLVAYSLQETIKKKGQV